MKWQNIFKLSFVNTLNAIHCINLSKVIVNDFFKNSVSNTRIKRLHCPTHISILIANEKILSWRRNES
jgi:hypothetical protein